MKIISKYIALALFATGFTDIINASAASSLYYHEISSDQEFKTILKSHNYVVVQFHDNTPSTSINPNLIQYNVFNQFANKQNKAKSGITYIGASTKIVTNLTPYDITSSDLPAYVAFVKEIVACADTDPYPSLTLKHKKDGTLTSLTDLENQSTNLKITGSDFFGIS